MNRNLIIELIVFVLILVALNFFFHLHISIIGSVVLTVIFAIVFRGARARRDKSGGTSGGGTA